MDSPEDEEDTVFFDEEVDCLADELMELEAVTDEEADVLDGVAVEEDEDEDAANEEVEDAADKEDEDATDEEVEDAADEEGEEDAELVEILPPLAKTAKSS